MFIPLSLLISLDSKSLFTSFSELGCIVYTLMMMTQKWDNPSTVPLISKSEVHIWKADLEQHSKLAEMQATLLSHDELIRVEKYRFPKDSTRYSVGRSICRLILGQYLDIEAKDLVFYYNRYGRPYIDSYLNHNALSFNVSHSENHLLLAVSKGREVGIDIERVKCEFDCVEIAKGFFSTYELAQLRALPPSERELGFITCWTQKEAYIKAQGMGLSLDLDSFDVSLDPKKPAELLSVRDDPTQVERWKLHTFSPFRGYISTLAAEGQAWETRFYNSEHLLDSLQHSDVV